MLETLLQPTDVNERCGFVMKDGSIIEIANVAKDPREGYEMDALEAIKHLKDAAATWHTHPDTDPNLSGEDYSGFLSWPDMEHIIIGMRNGSPMVLRYKIEQGLVVGCD